MPDPDALIIQYMGLAQSLAQQVWRTAPHALELDELCGIANLGLVSAARRWEPYCVTPDTPILTADLNWVRVDTLRVGDSLVGVDEYPVGKGLSRSYRPSTVTSTGERTVPGRRITFSDGTQVTSSIDHMWLTFRYVNGRVIRERGASKNAWIPAAQIRLGDRLVAPLRVRLADESYEGTPETSYRTVVEVEDLDLVDVITLETSTRTYIANGIVAHNCAEKGFSPDAVQYFKPFVVRRVYGALIDAIRAADWATRSLRARAKALQDAGQDKGVPEKELALRSGMTVQEVRNTIRGMSQRPVSIEAEELDPIGGTRVESDVFTSDLLDMMVGTIRDLEPDQQIVLTLHYFQGLQLQEVARTMGISESRASQLHARAVLAVHAVMVEAARHRESDGSDE